MKILITNDDGITSEGINTLARVISTKHNIMVVAPSSNQSATSHALTIIKAMRLEKLSSPFTEEYYGFAGTPADCVKYAIAGLNYKPDLIISGINHGQNLAFDVLYSGTVSAAMEGAISGYKSIAVSSTSYKGNNFEFCANFVLGIIEKLMPYLNDNRIFNINIPNLPDNEIKGYKFAPLGQNLYSDHYIEPNEGHFALRGEPIENYIEQPNADIELNKQGYITITPMIVDRTDYELLKELK